jgi:hypothetical protein
VNWAKIVRGSIVEEIAAHGWTIPEAARVSFTIFGTFIDADNAVKTAMDCLKQKAIKDDNRWHMRGFAVEHADDDHGPRMLITVTPCEPLVRRKPMRKSKPKPLPQFAAARELNRRVDELDYKQYAVGELVPRDMVAAIVKKEGMR